MLCLALLVGAFLPGCIIVSNDYNDRPQFSDTRTLRAPFAQGQALDLTTRNGSVEISTSPGSEAVITATVRGRTQERVDEAKVVASNSPEGLRLEVAWPDGRAQSGDGCAFRIQLPAPGRVIARTSNGRLTLQGASGQADLDTSNGSIRVYDHAGSLHAETSNGSIEARRVSGDVDANTSNAAIDLVEVGGRAFATTSNGHITIQLSDSSPGPIQARSSNGGIELDLGRSFAGELRLSTSNGRIRFDTPVTVRDFNSDRSATLQFGAPGTGSSSTAATSNGSIRVLSHTSAREPAGSVHAGN